MVKMADQIGVSMTSGEVDAFLTRRGHGVLSMGYENKGYGVPISYGYDDGNERIVFQFVNLEGSKKQTYVDAAEEVSLTVYSYDDQATWKSVIVTGSIHPIDDTDVSERVASMFFANADDAAGEIRWIESEQFDRQWYELRSTEMTGRAGGQDIDERTGDGFTDKGVDK